MLMFLQMFLNPPDAKGLPLQRSSLRGRPRMYSRIEAGISKLQGTKLCYCQYLTRHGAVVAAGYEAVELAMFSFITPTLPCVEHLN